VRDNTLCVLGTGTTMLIQAAAMKRLCPAPAPGAVDDALSSTIDWRRGIPGGAIDL
jgi:hypothetical protein